MSLIPNVSAKTFSFSAVIVGYLLIDDMTANEQNALGNWLMLVAQVLSTNAFYKQVQQERGITSNKEFNPNNQETIDMLEKMINALTEEVNELKKNII